MAEFGDHVVNDCRGYLVDLMIPFEVASIFFFASAIVILAPGPDNIFVLTQSALHGRSAGLMVHTAAVSFGVAAIFQTSALAFNILKILGILYLLYIAWQNYLIASGKTWPF